MFCYLYINVYLIYASRYLSLQQVVITHEMTKHNIILEILIPILNYYIHISVMQWQQ